MIAVELTKQGRRPRTIGLLVVVALMAAGVAGLIGATRPGIPERIGNWGSVMTNASGFALPLVVLNALQLFVLPLSVSVVAGECVAGEAAWGSLRYLLIGPVTRQRVLGAKILVAAGFSVALMVITVVASAAVSVIAFGWKPLNVIDLQHSTPFYLSAAHFDAWTAAGLTILTAGYVLITMLAVFGFAILMSTLTDHSFGAVAGGIGLSLVSRALDNIPGLHALSPYLPMTDAQSSAWTAFFVRPFHAGTIVHTLIVQGVYGCLLLTAAAVIFSRSDVLA